MIIRVRVEQKPWRNRQNEKKKLAERKAKRQAKGGVKKEFETSKIADVTKPLSLEALTNPDKNE